MNDRGRAEALVRATLSLADAGLRSRYLAATARTMPIAELARALDVLCSRAEQAEAPAREALIAVVDALNEPDMEDLVQRLREEAVGESLLSLERLIRHPARRLSDAARPSQPPRAEGAAASGSRGKGAGGGDRELTLGERKSLARRPDRDVVERLLRDPHPDVVARCLRNPRVVEDDVVRLAAMRPARAEALAEVARSRWVHRPRVRMALVFNRATPVDIAVRIVGLLLRPELELVAHSPGAPPAIRALCLEHLARRPPGSLRPSERPKGPPPSTPNVH